VPRVKQSVKLGSGIPGVIRTHSPLLRREYACLASRKDDSVSISTPKPWAKNDEAVDLFFHHLLSAFLGLCVR